MLKRVYSRTLKTFKTIEFEEGFNFVISKGSDGKINNGTGKTSLLQIINFCLCSGSENIANYEDINKQEFSVDLQSEQEIITLSRSPFDKEKIKVIDKNNILGEGELNDAIYSTEKVKKLLNNYFFSGKGNNNLPSFRTIISPFMKRGTYAFNNPFKTHSSEKNLDTQLKNAFLLNFDIESMIELKHIVREKDQYIKLKAIKDSDLIWEKTRLSSLNKVVNDLQKDVTKLQEVIDNIVVNIDNQEVVTKIDYVNKRIEEYSKRKFHLINIVRRNRELLKKNKLMNTKEIESLLNETSFITNQESLKSVNEIQNFHRRLIDLREKRIILLIENSVTEKNEIEEQMTSLQLMKDDLQEELDNNEYLKRFMDFNQEITNKKIELESLTLQRDTYHELNEIDKRSKKMLKTVIKNMKENIEASDFNKAKYLFEKYTLAVLGEKGALEVSVVDSGIISSRGYKFEWKISRKLSTGYLRVCIAIYDIILAELNAMDTNVFLIHDSPVFEATDKSCIPTLLNVIFKTVNENSFQYICCINEDQVIVDNLNNELKKIYMNSKNVLTQDNSLFGVNFSK